MSVSTAIRQVSRPLRRSIEHLPQRLTPGVLVRMAADSALINAALIGAFTIRFIGTMWLKSIGQIPVKESFYGQLLHKSISAYGSLAPLLTVLGLVVFYASGFYTHGRAYRGRYKSLVVFQAVTLVYVLFAAISYLLLNVAAWFPRSVWLGGWLLTLLLVWGVRIWSKLWRATVWAETKLTAHTPKRATIRNVLVIGGAGYVGSVLVRKLLRRGYRVTVMDALLYGDDGINDLYRNPRFSVIRGDLRNIEAVVGALRYADAVVHLGGLVGDPACAWDEKLTHDVNIASTRLVGEAARGFGVQRFIFTSSCSVYGASTQVLDERSTLGPVSLYAQTKLESERILLDLEDENFSPVILRFGTLYGISPRPRFDLVVNMMSAKAVKDREITVRGGDQWRPFLHVEDAAEGILKVIQAPLHSVKGEIFNVGRDEENYTVAQVAQMVKQFVPDTEVLETPLVGERADYRVSFQKIRKYLDFVPTHTVEAGIVEIRDAFAVGELVEYDDHVYSNHSSLTQIDQRDEFRQTSITPLYQQALDQNGRPELSPAYVTEGNTS